MIRNVRNMQSAKRAGSVIMHCITVPQLLREGGDLELSRDAPESTLPPIRSPIQQVDLVLQLRNHTGPKYRGLRALLLGGHDSSTLQGGWVCQQVGSDQVGSDQEEVRSGGV